MWSGSGPIEAPLAHTYTEGTWTITVTVNEEIVGTVTVTVPTFVGDEFDPGDYTVAEVIAYIEEHPDETQAVYDAEGVGKARVTLLTDLESRLA